MQSTRSGIKKISSWIDDPWVLKNWFCEIWNGNMYILNWESIVTTADATPPIINEDKAIVKDVLSFIELTTSKYSSAISARGTACNNESNLFGVMIDETRTKTAKRKTGMLKGFNNNVIFPSIRDFIPHRIKRVSAPNTTMSCFGRVKKSVVLVRKKTGSNKNIAETIIVDNEDI